jgi:phage/plasmid-associated DNA primase
VHCTRMYEDYKQWADDVGERTESERAFANHMRELIYDSEAHKREDENGVFYDGLGLRRA